MVGNTESRFRFLNTLSFYFYLITDCFFGIDDFCIPNQGKPGQHMISIRFHSDLDIRFQRKTRVLINFTNISITVVPLQYDFTMCSGALLVVLLVLMAFGFIAIFVHNQVGTRKS